MQNFPTNILYRQYRHYNAPLNEASDPLKIHTTVHTAQKLAITQYCGHDQHLPVKTEDDIQHEPILTGPRKQTNIFKVIFK